MSVAKKSISGIAWLSLANSGNQVTTLIVFITLARHLTLEEFGVVMLAITINNIFTILFKDGVVDYLVKHDPAEPYVDHTAFFVVTAFGILCVAFQLGAVVPLLGFLSELETSSYIAVMTPITLLNSLTVINLAYARRRFNFKVTALRNFANGFLTGVIAIIMALLGFGAWSLIVSRVLGSIGAAMILWLGEPYRPTFVFRKDTATSIIFYSLPIIKFRILTYLAGRMPEFLLAGIAGPAALAVFRVGGRLVEALNSLLLDPIANVLMTTFSKIEAPDRNRASLRITSALVLFVAPIYIGIGSLAPFVTDILYGSKWAESSKVLTFLSFQIIPAAVKMVITVRVKTTGDTRPLGRMGRLELASISALSLTAVFGDPAIVSLAILCNSFFTLYLYTKFYNDAFEVNAGKVIGEIVPYTTACCTMFAAVYLAGTAFPSYVAPLISCLFLATFGVLTYVFMVVVVFRNASRSLLADVWLLSPSKIKKVFRRENL